MIIFTLFGKSDIIFYKSGTRAGSGSRSRCSHRPTSFLDFSNLFQKVGRILSANFAGSILPTRHSVGQYISKTERDYPGKGSQKLEENIVSDTQKSCRGCSRLCMGTAVFALAANAVQAASIVEDKAPAINMEAADKGNGQSWTAIKTALMIAASDERGLVKAAFIDGRKVMQTHTAYFDDMRPIDEEPKADDNTHIAWSSGDMALPEPMLLAAVAGHTDQGHTVQVGAHIGIGDTASAPAPS